MRLRIPAVLMGLALVATACGGDDSSGAAEETDIAENGETELAGEYCGGAEEPETVRIQGLSSGTGAIALAVFEELDLDEAHGFVGEYQSIPADSSLQHFLAGESDVSLDAGPLDMALAAEDGEDVVSFGPAITNPVRVVVLESSEHETISDVVGMNFGQYGTDSTGSLYLSYLLDENHDITFFEDFELVTQAPPALLPLLESGQVEAALLFQPHLANAETSLDVRVIYDPDQEWRDDTGGRLWSTLQAAHREWVEANPDLAGCVHDAWCEAAEWMNDNVDEIIDNPTYSELLGLEGEGLEVFAEQVEAGMPFFGCEWTEDLLTGMTELLEGVAEQGTVITKVPDDVFVPIDELIG